MTIVRYRYTFKQTPALRPECVPIIKCPDDAKDWPELKAFKKVIEYYPVLGICLGHQLAAIALGGDTKKMLFGHRGANQPVCDVTAGKVFISSPNHSYAVDQHSIAKTEVEGAFFTIKTTNGWRDFTMKNLSLLTVQFSPEASPGPEDSTFIFEELIQTVKYKKRREFSYA